MRKLPLASVKVILRNPDLFLVSLISVASTIMGYIMYRAIQLDNFGSTKDSASSTAQKYAVTGQQRMLTSTQKRLQSYMVTSTGVNGLNGPVTIGMAQRPSWPHPLVRWQDATAPSHLPKGPSTWTVDL